MIEAPLIGIDRHRLSTDGEGVTTLVAFHGCPLHCRYCLNPQCADNEGIYQVLTPQELVEELSIDHLYFAATGGGVTFGGGEPLLRSAFIAEVAKIAPPEWHFYLESSLHVPFAHLAAVAPYIHHYYIDVKDMNPDIYLAYTGQPIGHLRSNLEWLIANTPAENITLRLPLIPNYNTEEVRQRSRQQLQAMGFTRFDEFPYIVKHPASTDS